MVYTFVESIDVDMASYGSKVREEMRLTDQSRRVVRHMAADDSVILKYSGV